VVRGAIRILQEAFSVKFAIFKLTVILTVVCAPQQSFQQLSLNPPAIHNIAVDVLGYARVVYVRQSLRGPKISLNVVRRASKNV
jgi:hypothetical protein